MGRRRRAERLFDEALEAHRRGRIDDAGRLYRDVLGANPRHAGALQHLGILAQQRGDVDESVCLLRQAATITPSDPLLQNNLGNALRSQGDHVQAISAYRAAVASDDGYVNALYNLAGLLQDVAGAGTRRRCPAVLRARRCAASRGFHLSV
jgi:tetratricopeptide (TPR) repeat protein